MNLEVSDKAQKWVSIGKLMKRIQNAFPYLINEDTSLKLPHKKKFGNLTIEVEGPLSYSLFMDDLESEAEMGKYHKHIIDHQGPIGDGDHRRETFWAEDVLMMLYSALKYELKRYEDDLDLLTNEDEKQKPADNEVRMPHFGMKNDDRAVGNWKTAYQMLTNKGWIRHDEVSKEEWVYACCGLMTPPKGPIVWHDTTTSLAFMVRKHFHGEWELAQKIFCLENNKPFPVSFNSTHAPLSKETVDFINRCFPPTNSH